eukprot:s633_g23.t1
MQAWRYGHKGGSLKTIFRLRIRSSGTGSAVPVAMLRRCASNGDKDVSTSLASSPSIELSQGDAKSRWPRRGTGRQERQLQHLSKTLKSQGLSAKEDRAMKLDQVNTGKANDKTKPWRGAWHTSHHRIPVLACIDFGFCRNS